LVGSYSSGLTQSSRTGRRPSSASGRADPPWEIGLADPAAIAGILRISIFRTVLMAHPPTLMARVAHAATGANGRPTPKCWVRGAGDAPAGRAAP